jgi:predicted PurR-regulated permease PerM
MERKTSQYKALSRDLINMALGDKLYIKDDKDGIRSEEDKNIEIKAKEGLPENKLSIQQTIYNAASSVFVIFCLIFGIFIPFSVFTFLSAVKIYHIAEEINVANIQQLFDQMNPILKYLGLLYLVCIVVVTAVGVFGVIFLLFIKKIIDFIDDAIVKNSIKNNYTKITKKLKDFDQEEDRLNKLKEDKIKKLVE